LQSIGIVLGCEHRKGSAGGNIPILKPLFLGFLFLLLHLDLLHLRFGFDLIYGGDSEQVTLWKDVGVPAMEKAFAGQRKPLVSLSTPGLHVITNQMQQTLP